ncbi:MAG TPA: hypothetical protein VKB79_00615 [Bryobacteraceae bacterium]|nr:hypothetical protein [Bryobacteraceae bacterium]
MRIGVPAPGAPVLRARTKIFDAGDPARAAPGSDLVDATVIRRADQWWMFLAGQAAGYGPTDLYSASLPPKMPLSATGWMPVRDDAGAIAPIAARNRSAAWDGSGGRHCPSYVAGWDPAEGKTVERIYYAGAADHLWGPYTIGFLQWDGSEWVDQAAPAFIASEEWEHGSVYEPNLIYHDGKWKMWYVAGSNQEDYLVHGYSESPDGRTGWSSHQIFAPPEMKMFDFCVRPRAHGFDAVFSRVWVGGGAPPPDTGLWWCRAEQPSGKFSDWTRPLQIMTAQNYGWHAGPWKPSFEFDEQIKDRALIFFDGLYSTGKPGPFPFAFTLGCAEVDLPL